jgi:hypothetical protein
MKGDVLIEELLDVFYDESKKVKVLRGKPEEKEKKVKTPRIVDAADG